MWFTDFITALVLKDIDTLSKLVENMPVFQSLEEMEQAAYLLAQAKTLVETAQSETSHTLKQLKNTIDFLKSAQRPQNSTLNLKL